MTQSTTSPPEPVFSTKQKLARWSYSMLLTCAVPILFVHWLIKFGLQKKQFTLKRLNRFSIYTQPVIKSDILIHCVSVGEVAVATSLINQLLAQQPNLKFTVTTTTPTGAENVKNLLANKVQHLYLPIDLGWMMSRMLNRVCPKQVLVVEVELWPNMIRQCVSRQIPVLLVNGRMTDKSARGYLKLAPLITPMLKLIKHVCAQSQRDYNNYIKLGIAKDKLSLTGNIKFELDNHAHGIAESLVLPFKHKKRRILVAGSTHEPEEQVLIEAVRLLKQQHPELLLFIVPRHPQRFDKVDELLKDSGLSTSRVTQNIEAINSEIVLVDKMGVLTDLYHYADFAFIGGSIAHKGGHNPLEAAAAAIPTMMGPHIHNNPTICDALKQSGNLVTVNNSQEIANYVQQWLTNESERIDCGQKGLDVIRTNQGALAKTIALIQLNKNITE